jgi:hypothetical protein
VRWIDIPVSWNMQPAAITTSESCSRSPWVPTIAGSTPARASNRKSRRAMLSTIRTCTQE